MPATPPVQASGQTGIRHGINIGNALEAPFPGGWGVEIQPDYFTIIRAAGFDTVRIPVRFSAHTSAVPPYTLEAEFMQLIDNVFAQALDSGLTVILDLHHYEEIMQHPADQAQRFLAIWQQLAERYQHAPENLYFELLNEPSSQLDAQTWNDLIHEAVTIIRASNPERKLIIGGVDFSNIHALSQLRLPDDRQLIATFHFYEPFEFTHQGASWVNGAEKWQGTVWRGNFEEKQLILEQLEQAVRWSEANGVGLVMGEFGAIATADAGSRQMWTAFLARETEKRNIGWIYWEFCAEFRVYDCQLSEWDDAMLQALIQNS